MIKAPTSERVEHLMSCYTAEIASWSRTANLRIRFEKDTRSQTIKGKTAHNTACKLWIDTAVHTAEKS